MNSRIFILLLTINLLIPKLSSSHGDDKYFFIENKGQWQNDIKFKAKIGGGNVWLHENSFTFDFYNLEDYEKFTNEHTDNANNLNNQTLRHHAYQLKFINAHSNIKMKENSSSSFYHNYFIGNDQSKWQSNVRLFEEIVYLNLYDGVDIKAVSSNGNFKYDIIVKAGADVNQIKWGYNGISPILDQNSIILQSNAGKIIESIPEVYQIIEGEKIIVECELNLTNGIINLIFPNNYNQMFDLIIDPTVVFSTYSGSLSDNWGYTATYDSQENGYSCGPVITDGFPVSIGAYDAVYSSFNNIHKCDLGIIKYSPDGINRLFATYLGGTETELPHSLIVDSQDNLILYGTTSSNDFPITAGAFDNSFSPSSLISASQWFEYSFGSDIFVSKLNANGTILLGSTYIGGSANDGFSNAWQIHRNYGDQVRGEVIVDSSNNIIVSSSTLSLNFPTTAGSYSTSNLGGHDGVVFKLSPNLNSLIWSTYIGGTLDDCAYGVTINSTNQNIYVSGATKSNDIPVTTNGIFTSHQGGIVDGYVIALNESDGAFIDGTYIGTNNYDNAFFIQCDDHGDIFVFGQTLGNFPVTGNVYSNSNSSQYIIKMNENLSNVYWSTLIGNGDNAFTNLVPTAFLVDKCNNIYLAGWGGWRNQGYGGGTTTNLPVTADAFDSTTDGSDFYIMVLSTDAENLLYATFVGGLSPVGLEDHTDGGMSRFDPNGIMYLAACASCGGPSNFPTTPGAWSNVNASPQCNMILFKMKFDFKNSPTEASLISKDTICNSYSFQGDLNADTHYWDFNDGTTPSSSPNPIHYFNSIGNYTILYISSDTSACGYTDTTIINVDIDINSFHFYNGGNFIVPNVFTPNQDGKNEKFRLAYPNYPELNVAEDLEEYHLEIYNRWGKLVFENTNSISDWNGKINGKPASEGVYYYILRYKRKCLDNETKTLHGYLTLLRE